MATPVIWVGYTTLYRARGARFHEVARTLARELGASAPAADVRLAQVESKRDFLAGMAAIPAGSLAELHLVAHGETYGPMFGSRHWPEQFSRHEWSLAQLPFAAGARAYFHSCRSARWFAPFFADRFGVETYGWAGAVGQYVGLSAPEALQRFTPLSRSPAQGYDCVASLYDAAFRDIRVRADEWRWLEQQLSGSSPLSVVDLGCGNGALLRQLAPRLERGLGLDASAEMVALARQHAARSDGGERLRFEVVDAPIVPVADQSVDRVVSLLAFRYLDWDPIVAEVRRVLRPGGRWLVVDMVVSPCTPWQAPALLRSKLTSLLASRRLPGYRRALSRLVQDPGWTQMLQYNPMRAEHEFSWYLSSRFPAGRIQVLNVALESKILAFDSGPIGGGRP